MEIPLYTKEVMGKTAENQTCVNFALISSSFCKTEQRMWGTVALALILSTRAEYYRVGTLGEMKGRRG